MQTLLIFQQSTVREAVSGNHASVSIEVRITIVWKLFNCTCFTYNCFPAYSKYFHLLAVVLKYFTMKNYFGCRVSITLLTLNGRMGNVKLCVIIIWTWKTYFATSKRTFTYAKNYTCVICLIYYGSYIINS